MAELFFRGLRHYVEKHPGKPRRNIMLMKPIEMSREEGWQKLTGPEGLGASGSLANKSEGERYSVTTSWGERFDGDVLISKPGRVVVLTIEQLDDAIMSASVEEMKGQTVLYLTLSSFGWAPERLELLRRQWTDWLTSLFSWK